MRRWLSGVGASFLITLLALAAAPAQAATQRIWRQTTGNLASQGLNWIGDTAPATGDWVVFGSTTPNQPCTWDLDISVDSFSITGVYASTVLFTTDLAVSSGVLLDATASPLLDLNGRLLIVEGDWIVGGVRTTSTVSGSTVSFNGNNDSKIQSLTGGPAYFNHLIASKNLAFNLKLLSDIEVRGDLTVKTGVHLAGSHFQHFLGDVVIEDGFFDVKASTIVYRGTRPQTISFVGTGDSTELGPVWIQNPSRVTLGLPIEVLIATTPNSTLIFNDVGDGELPIRISSMNINGQAPGTLVSLIGLGGGRVSAIEVTAFASASFTFVQDIDASPGLAVQAFSSINGGNNTNWTFPGALSGATKVWKYGGGSALASASGNWTPAGTPVVGDYVIFGSTTPTAPCTWDLDMTVSSLSVTAGYNSAVTLAADLVVSSGVLLDAGSGAALDLNGHVLEARGDWVVGDVVTLSGVTGSTVIFSGGGVGKLRRTTPGLARFDHLIVRKVSTDSGEVQLLSDLEVRGDFTLALGTFTAGGHTQLLRGDLLFQDGSFSAALSTVVFAGSAPRKVQVPLQHEGTISSFAGLQVQTASTVSINSISAGVLTATTPSAGLVFGPNWTAFDRLVINGQSVNTRIRLRSNTAGVQRLVLVMGSASVQYADIQDIDSSGGITPSATYSIGSNNINWSLPISGDITASDFTPLAVTSMTANWDSTYPGGFQYTAQLSSGAFPNAFTGNQSSNTLNLYAGFAGLAAHTTYYLQVSTPAGGFTVLNATPTFPQDLTGVSIAAVFGGSITVAWTPVSSRGYRLEASVSSDFTSETIFSSVTTNPAAGALSVEGLQGYTTYYLRAGALSWLGAARLLAVPGSTVTPRGLPAGCGAGVKVAKTGEAYTTIQSAIDALPASFSAHTCVVLADAQTYSEQVTIQGKTNNGFTLRLLMEPEVAGRAVVDPPAGSTAAFQVMNASVSLEGLSIITTNTVAYGVLASSAFVTLSSVSVDSGGSIWTAGVSLSSYSAVAYSSVTVQDATGIRLKGASSSVAYSTATNSSSGRYALHIEGVDGSTVTCSYLRSTADSAVRLDSGADYNVISLSTITSTSVSFPSLYLAAADSNTVTGSYIENLPGPGAMLAAGSDYNTINQTTVHSDNAGGFALRIDSARNLVADSYIVNQHDAVYLPFGADYNTISLSTMIAIGAGAAALKVESDSNTVTSSYLQAQAGDGVYLGAGAEYNTIGGSTLFSDAAAYHALFLSAADRNTVAGSFMQNVSGRGAYLTQGSDYNVIRQSTMTSAAAAAGTYALYIAASSSNTVLDSYVQGSTAAFILGSTGTVIGGSVFAATNTAGGALTLGGVSVNLTMTTSTVIGGALGSALSLDSGNKGAVQLSSLTVLGSRYGLLIATQAAGASLTVSSITFRGLTPGATAVEFLGGTFVSTFTLASFDSSVDANIDGAPLEAASRITLHASNGPRRGSWYEYDPQGLVDWDDIVPPSAPFLGAVELSSVTVGYGVAASDGYLVEASTRADFAPVFASSATGAAGLGSLSPQGLDPNTTYYLRAAAVYSGSYLYASPLTTSTLAMSPGSAGSATVYVASAALAWTANGNPADTTYQADASSDAFVTVTVSSRTRNLFAQLPGLWPNTTQYFRVRAEDRGGRKSGTLADIKPTLASPVAAAQLGLVFRSSAAVNWQPLPASPPDASSKTAEGYIVEASTAPDFTGALLSSATADVALGTLTISGLTGTTFYFRVGSLNWAGEASYSLAGSTQPPSNMPDDCPFGFFVRASGGDYASIQDAVTNLPKSLTSNQCVIVDPGVYAEQVVIQGFTTNGFRLKIIGNRVYTSSSVIVDSVASATAPFQVQNASVTLENLTVRPTGAAQFGILVSSAFVQISSVSVDSGGSIWNAGIDLRAAGGAVSQTSVTVQDADAVHMSGAYNSFSYSTAAAANGGRALYADGASSATISDSRFDSPLGAAMILTNGSHDNAISRSTATGAAGLNIGGDCAYNSVSQSYLAGTVSQGAVVAGSRNSFSQTSMRGNSSIDVNGSYNSFTQVYIPSLGGYGLVLNGGADFNTVSLSTVEVLQVGGGRDNRFTQSWFQGPVVFTADAARNVIAQSTITAPGTALSFLSSSSNTLLSSYVQGSTAVAVSGATGTVISGSMLSAPQAGGVALSIGGGALNFRLSSSAVLGGSGAEAAGVLLEAGRGLLEFSTNAFSGARRGFQASTQGAGAALWITSNTFILPMGLGLDVRGLLLSGLTSGATVADNGFYVRDPGPVNTAYGLWAIDSRGLVITRNRFADAGVLSSGSYEAVSLSNTDDTSVRNNDLQGAGAGLTDAYLLRVAGGSTGVIVKNNVFMSSFSVLGSSAALSVSADSLAGFQSDYNDFFSSNAFNTGIWGASSHQLLPAWQAGSGQDLNSISAHPRWHDTRAGVEDYHPRSSRGRYDLVTASFVLDPQTSPTIDAGDGAESAGAETSPNGGRLNQGSYGGTAEASRSAPPAGGVALTGVSGSSASLSWTSVLSDGYRADAALSADFTAGLLSSATANPAAAALSVQGLSPNTTYYLRLGALYGTAYNFAGAGSTVTFADAPLSGVQLFTALSSAAFAWSPSGNPAGTLYEAQVSTSFFFDSGFSSQTLQASATFFALTSNATYYLRVRAVDQGGTATPYLSVQTTTTFPASPDSPVSTVAFNSAALTWSGVSGNDLGTVYTAQISTDAFTTVNASSLTLAASATFFYSPLSNTTFYLRVRTDGHRQLTDYSAAAPLAGNALEPMGTTLLAVEASSMTLGYLNINPGPTTRAEIQTSTDDFSSVSGSSVTMNLSAVFTGLFSNATYYARARVLGHNGTPTAFTISVATLTDPSPPSSAPLTAVTASSARAEWGAAGNSTGTVYLARLSTDAFSTVNASSSTFNVFADFTGLVSATTYYFQVRAEGYAGSNSAFVSLPSTSTLLESPATAAVPILGVGLSSASVQWLDGGNGPTVFYEAQSSTDAFATVNAASATYNLTALFGTGGLLPALAPGTTHQFRVRAAAGGNFSAYVLVGSTATLPADPGAPSASLQTSSGIWSWAGGGNGAAAVYQAQLSTDAFATVNAASATFSLSASFLELSPNTTYYLRVRSAGPTGQAGAYAAGSASATLAAVPLDPAGELSVSSAALTWGRAGSPAGTVYEAQSSTDGFATVNFTSRTLEASATFFGLVGNTTYYLRARALGHGGSYTAFASTTGATLAIAPGAASLTAVELSSAALSWTANGNLAGTWYRAQASTDAFSTVSASSLTLSLGATFFSLLSNSTYYLRVQAVSHGGTGTAFSVLTATATRPAAPLSAEPSAVSAASVQANWLSNGNGQPTVYEARSSTDAFATVNTQVATSDLYALFAGLSSNTTYYFQTRVRGHDGLYTAYTALPSTMTLLLPPAQAGSTFLAVEKTSAAVQWSNGGNGPATVYIARLSTDSFATLNFASATLNLSVLFGAGGAGPALQLNTTYQFDVRATNGLNSSAVIALGSTATHAGAPTGSAAGLVSSTTIALDWLSGGNPEPGTLYELWRDALPAFSAAVKTALPTSSAAVSGLSPSTTYYFKVRAREHGGAFSDFDAVVSTLTLPPAPGLPGTPAGIALGVSSISWSWTAAALAQSYLVRPASNTAALIASTSTLAFAQASLLPNLPYGLHIAGFNASGEGPLSAGATVYTQAMPPSASAATLVQGTSATISWGLNGNPAATLAEVQRSTDNALFTAVYTASATSFTDFTLLGCTDYYYRVRNYNGESLPTGFNGTLQFVTLASTPAAPGGLSADALSGNRVLLSWAASPTEGINRYRLFWDAGTGTVNYGSPVAVLTSTETTFTTGVLASSAAYTFALRARHRCGVEETGGALAQSGAGSALPVTRAAVRAPAAGKRVTGNRLTVMAELTTGTPALTKNVRFQYKCSTDSASGWVNIATVTAGQANPDTIAPYFVHWDATGLTPASYDLRALASDLSGVVDSTPSAVTVVVDPVVFDIDETLVGGRVRKRQGVSNAASNLIQASDTGGLLTSIVLPAGALTTSSATLTVLSSPALPAAPPEGSTDSGMALEITLDSGQTALASNAQLTFSYPDVDGDGLLDGTTQKAAALKIYAYDVPSGQWVEGPAAAVDAAAKTVAGATSHFSFFAAFPLAAAAGLDTVRVYPVPFKPYGTDPDQGRPYRAGVLGSGIVFDNLPLSVTIKIFTLTGQLVTQFSSNNSGGRLQWDARNGDGRDAASGGYLAVISAAGQKSVVKRLSIIR